MGGENSLREEFARGSGVSSPTPASIPGGIRTEAKGIVTHFEVTVVHDLITTFHPSYNKESRGGYLL